MYPDDIAHYLSEIARVLKPGGTLAASYFLYNDDIIGRMQRSETKVNFNHEFPGFRTTNPNIPEDALAVNDQWLLDVQTKVGLKPEPILYGDWSGHTINANLAIMNYQDIVVARKS
jgi:SAM-dependent methyltransferase